MPDGGPEKLQTGRSRADAEGVRRDPVRPPTDAVGPVSIVLVALTVASCVAVALGAPDLLVAIPAVCAAPPGIQTYADLPVSTSGEVITGTGTG